MVENLNLIAAVGIDDRGDFCAVGEHNGVRGVVGLVATLDDFIGWLVKADSLNQDEGVVAAEALAAVGGAAVTTGKLALTGAADVVGQVVPVTTLRAYIHRQAVNTASEDHVTG